MYRPLRRFYNGDQMVLAGDLVLLQRKWGREQGKCEFDRVFAVPNLTEPFA